MPDANPHRPRAIAASGIGLALGLVLASLPAAPALAQAGDRSEALDRYVAVAAAAFFAEGNCPDLRADAGRITTLRLATRIGAAEEETVAGRLRARASALRQAFAEDGRAAWCEAAYGLFGPDGTMARGAVVRTR